MDQQTIVRVYWRRAPRYGFTAKIPEWLGAWLCARALVRFCRPFAVTLDVAERRPCESIARHMKHATVSSRFWGFAYVATGEA